jgi:SAM-dependent methyltransferase
MSVLVVVPVLAIPQNCRKLVRAGANLRMRRRQMRDLYFRVRRRLGILVSRLRRGEKRYAAMQKAIYSSAVDPENEFMLKEAIVGHYAAHEDYPYEEYLLKNVRSPRETTALDFGCGPGRMILRMSKVLKRVDGVDISQKLIDICETWTRGIDTVGNLYANDGTSLDAIASNQYDLVYSTIALQHIAVASIREALFREFHRVLRDDGQLALQMIYSDRPREEWGGHASWSENLYEVDGTNGLCDVLITEGSLGEVEELFAKCGFTNFSYQLAPLQHPTDVATNVIFLYLDKGTMQ